jgi:hypothetical protein
MLEIVKDKYLNKMLFELETRALEAKRVIEVDNEFPSMSPRLRALARAMVEETTRAYTIVRHYLEQIGCINKTRVSASLDSIYLTDGQNLGSLSIDELEAIVMITAIEDKERISAARANPQPLSTETEKTIQALIDGGYIHNRDRTKAAPRGNPLKGALVRKLRFKGYTLLQANTMADKMLAEGITDHTRVAPIDGAFANPEVMTAEVQAAVKKLDFSTSKSKRLMDIMSTPEPLDITEPEEDFSFSAQIKKEI